MGTPKSGRNRELPLSGDALSALKAQRHLRGELVFCAESGRAFKENECKWPMWRACKKAGLRKISWHVLRHYPDRRIIPHRDRSAARLPGQLPKWRLADAA